MIYLDAAGRDPGVYAQVDLPVGDRGLLYGDGLFETVLAVDGCAPLYPLHRERLLASASALRITVDAASVDRGMAALLAQVPADEHAMRITLTRGVSGRRGYEAPDSSHPTLLITVSPYSAPERGMRAITASFPVNPASPLARHKSLSALEKVLARTEALQAGADEALMLNPAGRIAEGAATNLFIEKGGRLITPPATEGCLPGVMRRRLLGLLNAVEQPVTVADLFVADGVYLTNALMGILPLVALDGKELPPGRELCARSDLFRLP